MAQLEICPSMPSAQAPACCRLKRQTLAQLAQHGAQQPPRSRRIPPCAPPDCRWRGPAGDAPPDRPRAAHRNAVAQEPARSAPGEAQPLVARAVGVECNRIGRNLFLVDEHGHALVGQVAIANGQDGGNLAVAQYFGRHAAALEMGWVQAALESFDEVGVYLQFWHGVRVNLSAWRSPGQAPRRPAPRVRLPADSP